MSRGLWVAKLDWKGRAIQIVWIVGKRTFFAVYSVKTRYLVTNFHWDLTINPGRMNLPKTCLWKESPVTAFPVLDDSVKFSANCFMKISWFYCLERHSKSRNSMPKVMLARSRSLKFKLQQDFRSLQSGRGIQDASEWGTYICNFLLSEEHWMASQYAGASHWRHL